MTIIREVPAPHLCRPPAWRVLDASGTTAARPAPEVVKEFGVGTVWQCGCGCRWVLRDHEPERHRGGYMPGGPGWEPYIERRPARRRRLRRERRANP